MLLKEQESYTKLNKYKNKFKTKSIDVAMNEVEKNSSKALTPVNNKSITLNYFKDCHNMNKMTKMPSNSLIENENLDIHEYYIKNTKKKQK